MDHFATFQTFFKFFWYFLKVCQDKKFNCHFSSGRSALWQWSLWWEPYCAVKKVFCKNYVRKRRKTKQKYKTSQKSSKTSKRFQLLPNASECIPMGPNGSKSLEKLAKTSKKLRKLWKTSQKLRKTSRKILQKLFSRRSMPFLYHTNLWLLG